MKQAHILLMSLALLALLCSVSLFSIQNSSYMPRQLKDLYAYIQADILSNDTKELAKYFLYKAKDEHKECLNFVEFNYPSAKDIIRIDYFYPLAECKNFKLYEQNQDANLSRENIVIANISIYFKADNVNEEIFINKKIFLYPKF